MKIVLEHIVIQESRLYKVKQITGCLEAKDLPREYMEGLPRFFIGKSNTVFIRETDYLLLSLEEEVGYITVEEKEKLFRIMRKAASRLSQINKKIKEEERRLVEEWAKREDEVIDL